MRISVEDFWTRKPTYSTQTGNFIQDLNKRLNYISRVLKHGSLFREEINMTLIVMPNFDGSACCHDRIVNFNIWKA